MNSSATKLNFFQLIRDTWQNSEIRKRLLFTLFILIVFKIISAITIPGVHLSIATNSGSSAGTSLINTLGILGGGGLRYFSLFALGVSPYITASIIIQLLSTNVIGFLTNLQRSGEKGRKTQDFITRVFTFPLAILQSVGIIELLQAQKAITFTNNISTFLIIIFLQIGGVYLALWMGDQINDKGVGNGISMIILAGIVSAIPFNFINVFRILIGKHSSSIVVLIGVVESIFVIIFYFFLIFITIFISQSFRHVPIKNIGSGLSKQKNDKSYILLRINISGVIPVIFASALMSIPLAIFQYVKNNTLTHIFNYLFNRQYVTSLLVNVIFIFAFTYFYSRITINPEQFAENLQKNGSYIPGITPGRQTANFLHSVLNRLNFYGASFISIITITPYLLSIIFGLPQSYSIGGTGILIFVVVILDMFLQIQSRLKQLNYKKLQKNISLNTVVW